MKTEAELRSIREVARRSINPQCPGCTNCQDWNYIVSVTTWLLDGDSEFDRLVETSIANLAETGR